MSPVNPNDDYRALTDLQFRNMADTLQELKERVAKLETLVTRGLLLLVANLVALVMSMAQKVATG